MRKLLLLLMLSPLFVSAQNMFGYYSHSEVLKALPEYSRTTDEYERLVQRCNAEIERNEQELTRYYVAFLDGQQDFPEPILRKRQKELQQMVDNSVQFRDNLKKWLSHAKDSMFLEHEKSVEVALEKVCVRAKFAYVINTDEVKYRYINPSIGVNITQSIVNEILSPVAEEVPVVTVVDPNESQSDEPVEGAATEAASENKEQAEEANAQSDESATVE